jgi:hypothetical protein
MKTLFAFVLLFDVIALSGASQVFIMKPIKTTGVRFAQTLATDNQTFPEPLDFGARKHFGLWGSDPALLRRGWVLPLGSSSSFTGPRSLTPKPRVFVLVVAVTKVTTLSTLFSLKEEQDHEREKKRLLASLSSLFLFGETASTDFRRGTGFQHPSFQQPDMRPVSLTGH